MKDLRDLTERKGREPASVCHCDAVLVRGRQTVATALDTRVAAARRPPGYIIIIINFLFVTLTCNAKTWNGVIKSSSQIYCWGRGLKKHGDHLGELVFKAHRLLYHSASGPRTF